MNRAQFMEQLRRLLSDIPRDERDEALDYYESYFDDAGAENEASVIRELGSPGKVAAIIKADLRENNENFGEYTERGYEDARAREEGQMPARKERGYHAGKAKSSGKVILILVLLVFLSPFLKGAAGAAVGILAAILLLPFLVVLGVGAAGIGLVVSAVLVGIVGINFLAALPASGLLILGIACLMMAVGILLCILLGWLIAVCLPALLRKVTDFCHNILSKKKKEA